MSIETLILPSNKILQRGAPRGGPSGGVNWGFHRHEYAHGISHDLSCVVYPYPAQNNKQYPVPNQLRPFFWWSRRKWWPVCVLRRRITFWWAIFFRWFQVKTVTITLCFEFVHFVFIKNFRSHWNWKEVLPEDRSRQKWEGLTTGILSKIIKEKQVNTWTLWPSLAVTSIWLGSRQKSQNVWIDEPTEYCTQQGQRH